MSYEYFAVIDTRTGRIIYASISESYEATMYRFLEYMGGDWDMHKYTYEIKRIGIEVKP